MALGTDFIVKYLSDTKDAIAGAKALELINANIAKSIGADFANMTNIVKTSFGKISGSKIILDGKEASKTIQDFTVITKNASGRFYELQGNIIKVGDVAKTVMTPGMKDVTDAQLNASKSAKNFGENLTFIAKRALLVMPIWAAFRAVMQSTQQVFTDSFNDLVKESLTLDIVKKTLQGTTEEITRNFDTLKTETQSLAFETGTSHDKIIETFRKFSSVGLDFSTAMAATNAVIKLSIITQSDAVNSAESLSHAFGVLIDNNLSVIDKQKQINDIISLTAELWKTNGFNIEEFTGSLEKFAITAKSVNFTTSETLALLATLSKSGLGSAGNLLRNSIGQLLVNLDKLAGSLGVKVNPALDNTFSILMKVLEQLNMLQKTNDLKGLESAKEALKDIFGGTRSAVPITALVTLYDTLKKNISLTSDINKFNKSFQDTEKVLGNVVARFHTANTEIGKSFVQGLMGADDFTTALDKIDKKLIEIQKHAESFGKSVSNIFTISEQPFAKTIKIPFEIITDIANQKNKINEQITQALKGNLPKTDLTTLFNNLLKVQTLNIDIGLGPAAVNVALNKIREQLAQPTKVVTEEIKKQENVEHRIADIMLKKADFTKLEGFAKKELNALGLSEVEVERRILDFRTATSQFSEKDLFLQKELVSHLQAVEEIELKRSRSRGLIDNQLELLKLQGATTLQILQQKIELEKMFGINQTRADLLRNELELNKEITKEKLNQNKVSSDSLKLFEIAQKFGNQTAIRVVEFLQKPYVPSLTLGGANTDLLPILKEFFSSQLEQMQAQEFFYKGLGTEIPIPERQAIQNIQPINLESIKLPDINTQIGQINVEIKKLFKEEDTSKQIIDAMLEAIRSNPNIENAINEKIDNF